MDRIIPIDSFRPMRSRENSDEPIPSHSSPGSDGPIQLSEIELNPRPTVVEDRIGDTIVAANGIPLIQDITENEATKTKVGRR